MKTERVCPLGSECEKAENNTLYRCAWYVEVVGKHPQTGEDVRDKQCAMYWMPILSIENSKTNRGQTQALESFRNETVKGQKEFNNILAQASSKKQLGA